MLCTEGGIYALNLYIGVAGVDVMGLYARVAFAEHILCVLEPG